MGKNLRTPQTLVYEEWMEEGNTSQSLVEYILQLNNRLKRCQDIAITRMKECQLKRKTWYDRDAVERKFVEGDLVMVLVTSKQNKLEVNWIGPGKVLSRISDTNYVIDLPGRRDRSTIYHVNLLKPYHRRPELVSLVVEEVSDDIDGDEEIPYPDKQCTKFDYHEILRESQLQLKLSPSQIDELKQVITKNKDVFSPDPGTTHLMRMDIELISDKPIKTKPYRMSPRQINILREEIKRLLELGVIEIGQSDYTSPLILVESPNKDPRPCVDYRRLNEITRAEFFPLPNMEEIVEKVSAAPYVTVMDLSKGYFQIPLTPRAQRYAAFVTPFGTYIPKKMMGLNATGVFLDSRVISFGVKPTYDKDALISDPVIIFLEHQWEIESRECVRWSDTLEIPESVKVGGWTAEGCTRVNSTEFYTTCSCDSLGMFALLALPPVPKDTLNSHRAASPLMRSLHDQFHIIRLNLSIAAVATMLSFFSVDFKRHDWEACRVLSGFIHYFYLSLGCWICILTHALFKGFIKGVVDGRVRFYLLVGWGLPLVWVGVVVASTPSYGYEDRCMVGPSRTLRCSLACPLFFISVYRFPIADRDSDRSRISSVRIPPYFVVSLSFHSIAEGTSQGLHLKYNIFAGGASQRLPLKSNPLSRCLRCNYWAYGSRSEPPSHIRYVYVDRTIVLSC
ncbi:retrovirus-related Pol polyprotein from transposon 17.6 [Trichonephila clavipes]|nr:retrovirus-related Pol polyprotein from transposon 17.6 [Trichonephila clavipes]